MDRVAAMLILLGSLVVRYFNCQTRTRAIEPSLSLTLSSIHSFFVLLQSTVFLLLALFAYAPIFCSCLLSLLYTLYLFMAYEEHGVHHAQERENQFWTIFALLFSTAMFFANDSPIALGKWNPSLGFFSVLLATYAMHTWDRVVHRREMSR